MTVGRSVHRNLHNLFSGTRVRDVPEPKECVGYEIRHSKDLLQRTFFVDDEIAERYRDWSEPIQFRFETIKATGRLMLVIRRV